MRSPLSSTSHRRRSAIRGLATVEYVILLCCIFLAALAAAIPLGPVLGMMLLNTSAWLSLPVP